MRWIKRIFAKLAIKKAIKRLFNFLNKDGMKSVKTTIAGIIGGISIIATQIWYGLDNDPLTNMSLELIFGALGMFGIGWFARDNDVTSKDAGAE